MAEHTPHPYGYYRTKGDGVFPRIAAAIADDFHDVWWSSEVFADSRLTMAERVKTRESPFKTEIARIVGEGLAHLPKTGPLATELRRLNRAVIDGIITTNYDGLLEAVFPEYRVFVGQDQLLFSDPQGVGEIYKIHGSATEPETLVITQSDYARFRERNPYLAATLLTTFVEHPVIFLGYSMSDPNVTELLVSIVRVLTTSNLARLAGRLLFVRVTDDGPVELNRTSIAVEGTAIPVWSMTVPNYRRLFEVLGKQRRKFPAALLRRLKEHIYALVLENDPAAEMYVHDIDAPQLPPGVEVVIGVGIQDRLARRGYVGLSRRDLLVDCLRQTSEFDARRVVLEALPTILRNSGNVPIYRYLRGGGFLTADGQLADPASVDIHVQQRVTMGHRRFLPSASTKPRADREVAAANRSFSTMVMHLPADDVVQFAGALAMEELPLEEVRQFLVAHPDSSSTSYSSGWAKLACLYDYYAYAREPIRS